jgi:transposase-like protein
VGSAERVENDGVAAACGINEIASAHEVHPTQVKQWKKQLQEGGIDVFDEKADKATQAQTEREATLYEQIGRLQMELAWLKKKVA